MDQSAYITTAEDELFVGIDLSEIISLYDVASLKLHQCAIHQPGMNNEIDAEIEQKESFYFQKQYDILEYALNRPLESEADIKNLLRLWVRDVGNSTESTTISGKLITALCRYYALDNNESNT